MTAHRYDRAAMPPMMIPDKLVSSVSHRDLPNPGSEGVKLMDCITDQLWSLKSRVWQDILYLQL
jgi:hypothetical protein